MIRNSIRNKLIVFLLAATIIPFSTSIAMTYFITKHNVIEETIKTNSNLIYQGKTNITNHLNVIQQASLSIYNDTSLYGAVENGAVDYLDRGEIFRGMQAIVMSVKEIQQAYLYLSNSNKSFFVLTREHIPQRRDRAEICASSRQIRHRPGADASEPYVQIQRVQSAALRSRVYPAPLYYERRYNEGIRNAVDRCESEYDPVDC